MITVSFVGDKELIARFDALPAKLQQALYRKVTELSLKLENKVKQKLTNDVLHVRTGDLRRSIHSSVQSSNTEVTGKVASSGDVKYAAIQEFGGTINHPGGTAYFIGKDGKAQFVSNKTSFAMGNWNRTKPHNITIPERSYLRSSLSEMQEDIKTGLNDAVAEALHE